MRVRAGRGSRARWWIGTALLAAAASAACSGPGTAAPQQDVTLSDLQEPAYFYQGHHLGEVVTVSAPVAAVVGDTVFELSAGDSAGAKLTVMTREPVRLQQNQAVQVTGTVGQLHFSAPSERVPYLQEPLYSKAHTESFIYDAVVQPAPG